jgi:hypothetical protein
LLKRRKVEKDAPFIHFYPIRGRLGAVEYAKFGLNRSAIKLFDEKRFVLEIFNLDRLIGFEVWILSKHVNVWNSLAVKICCLTDVQ